MGKFDKRLVGEKDGERSPAGKRRKFLAVTDTQTERKQLSGLAERFLRERCVKPLAMTPVRTLLIRLSESCQNRYQWSEPVPVVRTLLRRFLRKYQLCREAPPPGLISACTCCQV